MSISSQAAERDAFFQQPQTQGTMMRREAALPANIEVGLKMEGQYLVNVGS